MSLEPLTQRVVFLAVAAMHEGEDPEEVQEAIVDAVDALPELYEDDEPPEEFPSYAAAVAPDLIDAIDVVRRWTGEPDEVEDVGLVGADDVPGLSTEERLEEAREELDDAIERIEETGPAGPDADPEELEAALRVQFAASRVRTLEALEEDR